MLSDEFSDARRALEKQVAEATAKAAEGRSETSHALEAAKRDAKDARDAAATYADRAAAAAAEADEARDAAAAAGRKLDDEKRRRHADADALSTLRAELDAARTQAADVAATSKKLQLRVTQLEADLDAARTDLDRATRDKSPPKSKKKHAKQLKRDQSDD